MNVRELYSKYKHPFGDWTLPDMSGVQDNAPTVIAPWWGYDKWSPFIFKVAYCFEEDPYEVVIFRMGLNRQGRKEPQFIRLRGGGNWFPNTPEGLADCKQYIDEYISCAPCRSCKYDLFGATFRCSDCANAKVEAKGTDKTLYCDKSGHKTYVGDFYEPWRCIEYCKFFTPKSHLTGIVKDWGSWEVQDDYLRNCEYNPNCPLHSMGGKNATCTYEKYMQEYVTFNIEPIQTNDDTIVTGAIVRRNQWLNQELNMVCGVERTEGCSKKHPRQHQRVFFDSPIPLDEVIGKSPFTLMA